MMECLFTLKVVACLIFGWLEIRLPAPLLDPQTYRAPNGRFELRVEPSQRHGRGPATYRYLEEGKERWSKTLPYTLLSAEISNEGVVVGYWCEKGTDRGRHDDAFTLVMLDAEGKTRLTEPSESAAKRFGTRIELEPELNGFFVDETNDRLVVRVSDHTFEDRAESWWVYQLSTGKAKEKLGPFATPGDAKSLLCMSEAKAVVDTPLTLVRWWRNNVDGDKKIGAIFTLVDLKGKPVWQLDWIDDYAFKDRNEEDARHLCYLVSSRGAILACKEPGRFELFSGAKSERVSFQVQNEAGAWKVSEVGRAPYDLEGMDGAPLLKLAEHVLKPLGAIELKTRNSAEDSPIAGPYRFMFDGAGSIAFLHHERDDSKTSLRIVDQTGKLLRDIPLANELKKGGWWSGFSSVGGDRFVVTASPSGEGGKSQAYRVDAKTGELTVMAEFDCPSIKRLVGFADGSFAVLAELREKNSSQDLVIRFDRDGKQKWRLLDGYHGGELYGASDIARVGEDELVVLESGNRRVRRFDGQGKRVAIIDLKTAWKRTPRHPMDIATDVDGGFLVFDFEGSPSIVRMRRDGSALAEFQPQYPDGRVLPYGVQGAPDGRLWATDGNCVVRLSEQGVVDLVLGAGPNDDELHRIAGVALDAQDLIHAVDSRTGSIFVFANDGKLERVIKTKPTDVARPLYDPPIAFDDSGSVFLGLRPSRFPNHEQTFAHFSKNGERLGEVKRPGEQVYPLPGGERFVTPHYREVLIVDREGKTVREIKRKADGRWIEESSKVSVAADGTFAVLSHSTVDLYEANGDSIRTIDLPRAVGYFHEFDYDGSRIVVLGEGRMVLLNKAGGAGTMLTAGGWKWEKNRIWRPFLAAKGAEVWVFDGESKILKYALP